MSIPRALHILIADDNHDAADTLGEVLTIVGHTTEVVYDGEAAVSRATAGLFDLAILDIGMPKLDGYVCAERISAAKPELVMIALTGYGNSDDKRRSRDAGFTFHLTKPARMEALIGILQGVAERTGRRETRGQAKPSG